MDCREARGSIELKADGLLPREAEGELAVHLAACPSCAAEARAVRSVGPALRALVLARRAGKAAALDATWTRVRIGIEEEKQTRRIPAWAVRWAWVPAAVALAVLALLFYPTGTDRTPLHPGNFDVAVEEVESEAATVALVDRGEDLPRVIWIIEDGKT